MGVGVGAGVGVGVGVSITGVKLNTLPYDVHAYMFEPLLLLVIEVQFPVKSTCLLHLFVEN